MMQNMRCYSKRAHYAEILFSYFQRARVYLRMYSSVCFNLVFLLLDIYGCFVHTICQQLPIRILFLTITY